MEIIIYGLTRCRQTQKALSWLRDKGLVYTFQDFKKIGISNAKLEKWGSDHQWEEMLNRKGPAWRHLDQRLRDMVQTKSDALELMHQNPNLIRRPVLECGDYVLFGFDEQKYMEVFRNDPLNHDVLK